MVRTGGGAIQRNFVLKLKEHHRLLPTADIHVGAATHRRDGREKRALKGGRNDPK
jgi:hypothetical protein